MSTDSSANPQLSWGRSTEGSSVDSEGMTTPATSHLTLSPPTISSPSSIPYDLPGLTSIDNTTGAREKEKESHAPTFSGTRRAHVPTDIDIQSISSHAQAKALVQRAQQSMLDMDDNCGSDDDDDDLDAEGGRDGGRSPLSA
jgi:hypothetical protein